MRGVTRVLLAGLLAIALSWLAGCDDDEGAEADAGGGGGTETTGTGDQDPDPEGGDPSKDEGEDPLAELEDVASDAGALAVDVGAEPPARGCAHAAEPVRVWARSALTAIAADGEAFVVAGYAQAEQGGEELFLARVSPGEAATPLHRTAIEPASSSRSAPPALASIGAGRMSVVTTDGDGTVRAADVAVGTPTANVDWSKVGAGADRRFPPTVARAGDRRLVAWVDATGTSMRVKVARVTAGGEVEATDDVTPQSMGATAPAFVAGARAPRLLFVDARAAISPIVGVRFGGDGTPAKAKVARPGSHVFEPPEIAGVKAAGRTWVGYTAVGSGATTAVGLVRVDGDAQAAPVPLVPGTGYGRLDLAGTRDGDAAVFAASAPKGTEKTAPREVHVRRVDAEGPGPVAVVHGPDGTGAHPAIARSSEGVVAVSFRARDGSWTAFVRCDDGDGGADEAGDDGGD